MAQEQWTAIDEYIAQHLVAGEPALEAALRKSAAAGLPAISVSPNEGKLLFLLAQIQEARRILEVGTLGGYSTIWMARALPPDGQLVTLELETKHAEVARANLAAAGVAERVELRLGPALASLQQLAEEETEPFDFIFVDANKDQLVEYLAWGIKLARPGALIIADNVVRGGEILDETSDDPAVQGVRRFYDAVSSDSRVNATAIQTVGAKGYDGFAVLRVVTP